jgi:ABC-type amino acid transport system permease subunit
MGTERSSAARDERPAVEMRQRSTMEKVIETIAGGLGSGVGWLAESGVLFVVFGIVWLAVGVGLVWSQGTVDQAWQAIRELPLLVQAVVWLLFLPVMAGLWIWESSWPLLIRLLLVVGLAGWSLLIFLPKSLQGRG